jgi:hypothetical protein
MIQPDLRFKSTDPVSLETIRELESRIKAPLPKAYSDFLAGHGGCLLSGDATVNCACVPLPIFKFLGGRQLKSNLEVYDDLTAESKITIAIDMAGNPYVLDALTGTIHFLDFSVNPPNGARVAGSFEEFLAIIHVEPYK